LIKKNFNETFNGFFNNRAGGQCGRVKSGSMGNFLVQKALASVWTRKNQPLLIASSISWS